MSDEQNQTETTAASGAGSELSGSVRLAPYFRRWVSDDSGFSCGYVYRRLRVTGRWKLCSGPTFIHRMYIEHKGWFLRHWILEDDIEFLPEESEAVFSCGPNAANHRAAAPTTEPSEPSNCRTAQPSE